VAPEEVAPRDAAFRRSRYWLSNGGKSSFGSLSLASRSASFRKRSHRSTSVVFTGHWCGLSWYSGARHVGHELCRPGWLIHLASMRREKVCPHVAVTGSTNSLPLMGHVSASRSASRGTSAERPALVASG
jgi:hypothetical protein